MLFFLTGDIQTGKTRWLEALISDLRNSGIESYGVLAPGVWLKHRNDEPGQNTWYEKLGIDNLLLPDRQLIPFARRKDLVRNTGSYDENSQSARAQLAWAIDDDAITQVDAHLERLMEPVSPPFRKNPTCPADSAVRSAPSRPGLLVIDELGQLELRRGEGLTAAMRLVDRGSTPLLPHALIVVRKQLLDIAQKRFKQANWNGMRTIAPTEEGRNAVFSAFA